MDATLKISGSVARPRALAFDDLQWLPGQVPDVGDLAPGREGSGVRLSAVLEAAQPLPEAKFLTLESTDGGFSASVPLHAVADQAIVIYRLGDGPLPEGKGGPLRFLVPDVEACGLPEVDSCANVKFLGRIVLSAGPGRDTRPRTLREHEALHEEETAAEGHEGIERG